MQNTNLRLKIELNTFAKFYLKIGEKSTLLDLKRLISKILSRNYNINLKSFSIRSCDGFEILDIFRLGDILDDNQLLLVDPFTQYGGRQSRFDRNEEEYKDDDFDFRQQEDRSSYRTINKENINKENISKEITNTSTAVIKENPIKKIEIKEEPKKNTVQQSRIEIPTSSISTVADVSEKRTIEKPKEIVKTKDLSSLPPKPDNFKGFVIKKADILNVHEQPFDETCFKPLKKRKTEEEYDEEL